MAEDEEYDSDDSDSTVLLADFVDNPRKVDVKRRRLSNLHDRGNQTDEFDDENTAPDDASVSGRTGNSPEKKRNNVDKNCRLTKFLACIDKNNDTNIKNNDSKFLQNLDCNGKQVRHDIPIKESSISKGNSTIIDGNEIICLDSDDETQIDDNSQDQDEISARTCINNQHLVHKPARLTTRRATIDIIEQNKTPQTEQNKYPKLRVLKPCAINARRATTHFERIPKRAYTQNENKIESKGYRSTSRLPEAQSADINTFTNADCNNIGLRKTAVHNNTPTSTLATTKHSLKREIDQSNGFITKGPRQDTNVFLNVNTHKRCGSNNERQTDPKRIKFDAKPTEPAEINKNKPSNELQMTAVKESGRLESSEPYVDVQNEIDVMSAEHKAIDCVENEKNTGAVSEKAPVDTVDVNTKSTANSVEFDKTTPSKATQCAQIGLLDNLDASKTCVNVTGNTHRAVNDRIVRSDGDGETIPSDLQSTASAVNVCENMETSDTCIMQETSESRDKKETTKVQDVINKEQNNRMPTKVIQNQGSSNLQAALDTSESLDEFETERETSEVHDMQERNKAKDNPETSKPLDLVNDKHEVSKLQSGCKINEKQKTNKPPAKTVPNQTRHEQEAGNVLDKEKSSDKQEINIVQNDQVTIEVNIPETNGVQDNHETCEHKTSDNPELRKKQTDTVTSNTINEKESSKIPAMTTTNEQEKDKEYYELETNNVQDEQISNEILEQEKSTSENGEVEITVRENNVVEIQHRQEASNENKTTGSTNVPETIKKNDETSKASCDVGDDNIDNSLWKFHVNFFTRLKEYLKYIYPESAMELDNRIKTLKDNRNEQVLPDLKYSCPKCSRVSNYSSRILNNVENEENKTNPDGSKTCGFCNGIRKLHISYLKRWLAKKNRVNNKGTINITTSPVASRIDTLKEVSIQDKPTTKDKHDNVYGEASPKTGLGISNKRKSDVTHKEATDPKLTKAGTQETNLESVKNLTEVSQTSDQRHETFTNQRPNKIQTINVQYTTSPTTAKLNSSLQSDIMVNHAADSEPCNDVLMNSPEKSSNETTKEFQINTIDKNSHEACLTPKTNSDNVITTETAELNERGKHISEDRNQTIEGKSNENINKERQSEVDQNGNEKASTSTGSIPETNEVNVNQVRTTEENDQGNGDVLKPLMDCFVKIKNSINETEDTVLRDREENKTPPESSSKIRPMIRGNRSNSLDNLHNRDDNKIVMKYLCPICTTIYVYSSKLLRHIQGKHNNPNLTRIPVNCERLQCPFCRTLLLNKDYNKHIKTTHPEKANENVGGVENSSNTNKCENVKRCSMKNNTVLNRGNTESTKSSDSEPNRITPDKKNTAGDTTRQQKSQRRSEYKYQHLIRRINIAELNKDKHDEIPGDKNQGMCPHEGDTQHISIENESHSPATVSTGVTSNINSALPHVNHTEGCCHESDKSSGTKSAEKPNEEESTPTKCNVRSLRKDSMHNTNETCHVENNDSKLDETRSGVSIASKESINNQIFDEEHSSRRVSNDECNESRTGNSHGIDNDIAINSANATLAATFTTENGKQCNNELSTGYINNDKQPTENTAIEGTQIRCSNINKEKETDSEDGSIKASSSIIKKRKERISKLFGDENEASVSSKIKASNELFARQKESQTPKDRYKKTKRRRRNRKADVVHRRRKVTGELCTESVESSDTSDSDWNISNDESSDRSDSYDEYCPIEKQQVVRKLFSSEKKLPVLNEGNEESCTESGDNNDDSDDETIISSRYTVKKKNERLSKLFGDDSELSVSNELSQEDNRQVGRDKYGLRVDRQRVEIEEGNNESVPRNNEQELPSDDETLKVSEQTIKKRKSRLSNNFGEDDEALVQDSNQQEENSDDLNNSGCRIPAADEGRDKDVNVRLEDTQCRVEIPELRDPRINNEKCLKEISHQDTFSRKSGIEEATDRNGKVNVSEENNVNAVRNAENKSRVDDRIEINMIDGLLKEFASDDHQNGTYADKENDNEVEDTRNSEINGVSQSAMVDNCLENIRITNVISVGGKTNVFICQECNYGTDAYDDAIRHCQNHYNLIEEQVTYCGICQINYDAICFERHQSNHDKYVRNIKIKFSYHWLFKNWQEVFENNNTSLCEAEDMQVKSIYKTFCVKMTVKEDGPWQSSVYLCAKCKTCVPSFDVELHVQQQCTFANFPCGICNQVFLTYELLKHHEIYHTDDATNIFKTIVFNEQNDDGFNSKLRQVKAQSREKERIADIFKCLCDLCFISLGKFKLHFAYCDAKVDEGIQCPRCPGIRLFLATELEEHLLLHHSAFNYKFRVQKITFQLESIDSSERETPSENSNATYNASQMTLNDEELNIKTDMLKEESFTQSATEENIQENLDANDEEDKQSDQTNETVPKTSDSIINNTAQTGFNDVDLIIKQDMLKDESLTQTTDEDNEMVPTTSDTTTDKVPQITLVEEGLNINRNMEQLTQISNGENGRENTDTVEEGLINETVPEVNEDLAINSEMLKEETLTQNTNEENSQEILEPNEKEDIREGNSQEICAIEDSENPVDTEASEVMAVEESVNPINIEDSQEVNETDGDPIVIDSQEMEEESTHLITIEDSDDEDVEFVGGSFPDTSMILPRSYYFKR